MLIQILKTKIQELTVSESCLEYPGSIALPEELLNASGIHEFELVHVNNKTNGNRITTYAVKSSAAGRVTLNGAASHLFRKGDKIHVLAYCLLSEAEVTAFLPKLVIANSHNRFTECKPYRL